MKKCPYCGKEILENDKFCGWCGKKLPVEPTEEEKKAVEEIKRKAFQEKVKKEKEEREEKERRETELIRKKAEKETEGAEKTRTRKEKIIEKLTETPLNEKERRENYLKFIGAKKKKSGKKPPSMPKIKGREVIFRPLLKIKPSTFEKIWIRVLLLVLIFSLVAATLVFGLDIFKLREGPIVIIEPEEEEKEEEKEEEEEEIKIVVPSSLLKTSNIYPVEISSLKELPSALSEIPKADIRQKSFTRIIIKNLETRKTVELKEFLEEIKVETPEDFHDLLKAGFTFFSYEPVLLQLGFISEIKEGSEGKLKNILNGWQKEMVSDFSPFFALFGKEKLMVEYPFRQKNYLGETFYYTDFYQENLGMAYGTIQNLFILTSSEDLMEKVLERKVQIKKELKLGDEGVEVEILQTWLAEDLNIYPEGYISGFYGELTQKAVKRFQQKYPEEILRPYGLVEGTGRVDEITMKKLNEVYRK
jgi:hypothetical protein